MIAYLTNGFTGFVGICIGLGGFGSLPIFPANLKERLKLHATHDTATQKTIRLATKTLELIGSFTGGIGCMILGSKMISSREEGFFVSALEGLHTTKWLFISSITAFSVAALNQIFREKAAESILTTGVAPKELIHSSKA